MKILIYGMQSSGASLITFFLAQKQDSLAIIDLWHPEEFPGFNDVDAKDIIVKCVLTSKKTLESHLNNIKPDKKILVLRHPFHNYSSLNKKLYGNESGHIDDKFMILEKIFNAREIFDLVMLYEDFIFHPTKVLNELNKIGFEAKQDFFQFKRTKEDMVKFNLEHSAWCKEFYQKKWAFGHICFGKKMISLRNTFRYATFKEKELVNKLCPSLCQYYRKNFHWNTHAIAAYLLCMTIGALSSIKKKFVNSKSL